ncbi:MAG: hypothetical protein U0R50_04035 [Gaiellales bacterium]
MRGALGAAIAVVVGALVGAITGALLADRWWDFPPADLERWHTETVVFYAALGAVAGVVVLSLVFAVVTALLGPPKRVRPSSDGRR